MKKVYLVHESGKKYGPFEMYDDAPATYGAVRLQCFHPSGEFGFQAVNRMILKDLGFRIEEAPPEKITITKENFTKGICAAFQEMWGDSDVGPWEQSHETETVWQKLCEIAEAK